ncbi:MAG: hypothetical protein ACLTE2_11385 [Eubacteriales bacterium]
MRDEMRDTPAQPFLFRVAWRLAVFVVSLRKQNGGVIADYFTPTTINITLNEAVFTVILMTQNVLHFSPGLF